MELLYVLAGFLLVLGLFILVWDYLKKSNSVVIRTMLMPWVILAIFSIFKTIQVQAGVLEKGVVVKFAVTTLYPTLPSNVKRFVSKTIFQMVVESSYVFIENHSNRFTQLLEQELATFDDVQEGF